MQWNSISRNKAGYRYEKGSEAEHEQVRIFLAPPYFRARHGKDKANRRWREQAAQWMTRGFVVADQSSFHHHGTLTFC